MTPETMHILQRTSSMMPCIMNGAAGGLVGKKHYSIDNAKGQENVALPHRGRPATPKRFLPRIWNALIGDAS